ncbi:amino acid/polyamine transporter I [Endogone sp. FLAS-F59071]|nr:amino acid/polyamine transporter I [Endogone sp. FLAS-F59071]|eukprot:RUS16981.1 amino acid/polyamine transporter I [Endogone sp. FLAS-F59071]
MIVGSGIFSTPSGILTTIGSPGMSLVLWVVGGIVSYFGVMAYLECCQDLEAKKVGTRNSFLTYTISSTNHFSSHFPHLEYLDYEFPHPKALAPYLFCVSMIGLIRSGFCAADSVVTGTYLMYAAGIHDPDLTQQWIARAIGVVVITFTCAVHAYSVRIGVAIENVLTVIKILTLLLISITGIVVLAGGVSIPKTTNFENAFAGTSNNGNAYASALFKIFFAYDGWNNCNYVLDELKNPIRTLKISSLMGITIVSVLYILANVAYFAVVPFDVILTSNTVVAGEFFVRVFGGTAGNVVLPVLVALSALGSVMCMSFTAGRVIFEAAREGYMPFGNFFGKVSKLGTPSNAFIVHWVLTLIWMLAPPPGDAYNFILDVTSYPEWWFYGLSVVGLIYLRFRDRDIPRPFRSSTITNVLFILVALFLGIVPFVPPTVKDTSLPYWLYPTVGLAFIAFSALLWYFQVVLYGGLEKSVNIRRWQEGHRNMQDLTNEEQE